MHILIKGLLYLVVISNYLIFHYVLKHTVCTVEIDSFEVAGSAAVYSFTGVGSAIRSYICKLDGDKLPDCMFYP